MTIHLGGGGRGDSGSSDDVLDNIVISPATPNFINDSQTESTRKKQKGEPKYVAQSHQMVSGSLALLYFS